jgi:hypothetical protein
MENAHIWIFTGAVIGMIAVVLDKGLALGWPAAFWAAGC